MATAVKNLEPSAALYSVDHLPESDGKPMGETSKHVMLIVEALNALQGHFRDDPQMFIIGNVFVYFLDEDDKLSRVEPDIFVVRGVGREDRRVYAVEREGKPPELVIEFTSKKTRKADQFKKKEAYAYLGVKEYFLFDPFGEYLRPRLQGFRLIAGEYIPIAGSKSRLLSEVLELELAAEGSRLRFWNPRLQQRLRTHEESEAELARLRAELHRLRGEG
jgi:Uma2 family endonuclease